MDRQKGGLTDRGANKQAEGHRERDRERERERDRQTDRQTDRQNHAFVMIVCKKYVRNKYLFSYLLSLVRMWLTLLVDVCI